MATEIAQKLNAAQAKTAVKIGQDLATKPKAIDSLRLFSQGKGGGATMITEEINAPTTTVSFMNTTSQDANVIVCTPTTALLFESLYGGKWYERFGATHVALEIEALPGVVSTMGAAEEGSVSLVCQDQGRTFAELLGYAALSPHRILSFSMESRKATDNTPDTTNYSANLKTIWWSPFHKPVEDFYTFRKRQNNGIFSAQYLDVNFKKEGFPVLITQTHMFIVTVRKQTEFIVTMSSGISFDPCQLLFRGITEADQETPTFSYIEEKK